MLQSAVAEGPVADPSHANAAPSSLCPLVQCGAPASTSAISSPSASPAVDTDQPRWAPAWSDSADQSGEAERPVADPYHTYTAPSSACPFV